MDRKTVADINRRYCNAKNRLVLLDYNGTLVNHKSVPDMEELSGYIADTIVKLKMNPRTKIFIITGRLYTDIDKFLDHIPVNKIAEDGAMLKENGIWKNQITDDYIWKQTIVPIMNQINAICPGSFVEEKNYSLAWHYRNSEVEIGYTRSRESIVLMNRVAYASNLKIMDGNKVVEILSNDMGKKRVVRKLIEKNNYDFVLLIGDDETDEEMFECFLNHTKALTLKVGEGNTCARYKLDNIHKVAPLLKHLTG